MDKFICDDFLEKLYAAFSKAAPRKAIKDVIFEQLEEYPDDFCPYALSHVVRELDSLPANAGRYLRLSVYPAFQASHGLYSTGWGDPSCQHCHGSGMLSVWRIGEEQPSPTGENAPCSCCTRLDLFPGWTRGVTPEEVERSGVYTMKNLFLSQPWHDESIKKRIPPARMATALQEAAYKQDRPDGKKLGSGKMFPRGTFTRAINF